MFYKLAFNNVKRSIRDYTVYFLTITFGICIFYVFNSIDSQHAMLKITSSQEQMLQNLSRLIGYVSVFISVILGFLIIYANNFLIKRRKKELGLYLTLGLEKGRVSRILIFETLIIGILALIIGLVGGIFLSHGFSVVTSKLFEVDMKEFTFMFSKSAFIKSILYFGLTYIIVMFFNSYIISKYKLIDLLQAGKRNEKVKIKKVWVSVVLFILSILFLIAAYWAIIDNGLMTIDAQFFSAFILCAIGTFLFFFSLSGFVLKMAQSNKKLYFKNLNMFLLRQFNNKINTTFISMTMICLMLAVTIVALCSGMAISDSFTKELEENTPYDSMMVQYNRGENDLENFDIAQALLEDGVELQRIFKEYQQVSMYPSPVQINEIVDITLESFQNKYLGEGVIHFTPNMISLSEANTLLALQGKEPILLADNEFILNASMTEVVKVYQSAYNSNKTISVFGHSLKASDKGITTYIFENTNLKDDTGVLIVPDDVVSGQEPMKRLLCGNYIDSTGKSEELFNQQIESIYGIEKEKPYSWKLTQEQIYTSSKGMSTTMTYLTIYIGIVFLITSAAVLALIQLSETSDNIDRYMLLSKLGTEDKMIKNTLFKQILIYFITPLTLAIVHSIIGISVSSEVIKQFGKMNLLTNILMTSGLFLLIYGGYFAATYLSSRNIYNTSLRS